MTCTIALIRSALMTILGSGTRFAESFILASMASLPWLRGEAAKAGPDEITVYRSIDPDPGHRFDAVHHWWSPYRSATGPAPSEVASRDYHRLWNQCGGSKASWS